MSDMFIGLYISLHDDYSHWIYGSLVASKMERFADVDAACEHFARRLIVTGVRAVFQTKHSRGCFKLWLNKQPNKHDLAKLLDLQVLLR